ncbi:hypothetical protein HHI36_023075 [Cryptolaemus montrouzieri]|uniref:Transmembrane protein n=1 Tax=Cryptolaemus montrouzieri TaxID=559131 RepID=A0ABD2PFP4_9CUCU
MNLFVQCIDITTILLSGYHSRSLKKVGNSLSNRVVKQNKDFKQVLLVAVQLILTYYKFEFCIRLFISFYIMRYFSFLVLLFCVLYAVSSAPLNQKNDEKVSNSSFGQPFDEIVVQSSLTIRRKDSARQVKEPQKITSS